MRTLLYFVVLALVPGLCSGGPNAGGVLLAHDPEIAYTSDIEAYCSMGSPATCADTDPRIDGSDAEHVRVWQVYAAFDSLAAPRLKELAFGIRYPGVSGPGENGIVVVAAGPCDGWESPGSGWPASDSGTSVIFDVVQTGRLVQCYWFAGYDAGAGVPQVFELRAHPDPSIPGTFFDDSAPQVPDSSRGFGSLGFDAPGTVVCPETIPDGGACCFLTGICWYVEASACPTGDWTAGVSCEPSPCTNYFGACCEWDGSCRYVPEADCASEDWRQGIPCSPEPCPVYGACCEPDGSCALSTETECSSGDWRGATPCDPNPCSTPGACCRLDGSCESVVALLCADGTWHPEVPCQPNPCPGNGPNRGGTLILHDPGLLYTSDLEGSCGTGAPMACNLADTRIDGSSYGSPRFVRVYAAFDSLSTPRLTGVAFGIRYDEAAAGTGDDGLVLLNGGPCGGWEYPEPGWPSSDTGTQVTFERTRTERLVECYWFGAYSNVPGTPEMLELRSHPDPNVQGAFVDDSAPAKVDFCAGFGSLGFDVSGDVACPEPIPDGGACCFLDGMCWYVAAPACPSGDWRAGEPCEPSPCVNYFGACCVWDGSCRYLLESDCATGDWRQGIDCSPNPCPVFGACCWADGNCLLVLEPDCPTGDWRGGASCDPVPCSRLGSCCRPDGTCDAVLALDCGTGDWRESLPCDPNPCPGSGIHRGGTLILHDSGLAYTTDLVDPCGLSALSTCDAADARIDGASQQAPGIWEVYAAFHSSSAPRLRGVAFGIHYDDQVESGDGGIILTGHGPCAPLENPDATWPGDNTGTVIWFEQARTDHLVECYWFAGYVDLPGAPKEFALRPHPDPSLEGAFFDDSFPVRADPAFGFGVMGLDTPGTVPCPVKMPWTPEAFSLLLPMDSESLTTSTPTLLWQHAADRDSGDAVQYTMFWSEGLAWNTVDSASVGVDTFYTFQEPLPWETWFRWKVRARDGYGLERWCSPFRGRSFFVTRNSTHAPSGSSAPPFDFTVLPGVRDRQARLVFSLPEPCDALIRLYDVAGRERARILFPGLAAGWHQRTWEPLSARGTPLPSGRYWLALSTRAGTLTKGWMAVH